MSSLSLSSPPLSLSTHHTSDYKQNHFNGFPERRASTSSLSPPNTKSNISSTLSPNLRASTTSINSQLSQSSNSMMSPSLSRNRINSVDHNLDLHRGRQYDSPQTPTRNYPSINNCNNTNNNTYFDVKSPSFLHSVNNTASRPLTPRPSSTGRKLTPPSPVRLSPCHSLSSSTPHLHPDMENTQHQNRKGETLRY